MLSPNFRNKAKIIEIIHFHFFPMETKRISINPVARLLPLLEVKRSPFGFVYWVAGRVYTRRGLLDELVGGERTTQIYGASAVLIFLFCKRKKKKSEI